MAACAYCHRRKGKRQCPALEGLICTICCGTHRGTRISCPADCIYFSPGEAYQRERLGHQLFKERQPLYEALHRERGEQALVILNLCDFACYSYAVRQPAATDQELLEGLEGVRAKLSPLTVEHAATSLCTQHLWGVIETWLKQEQRDREMVRAVLDQAIAFARDYVGAELSSRTFMQGLLGMIDERFPEQAQRLRPGPEAESRIVHPAEAVKGR